MDKITVALLLSCLLYGCGSSSGDRIPPDDEGGVENPQLGARATVRSDESGLAATTFAGREADVIVADLDTNEPIPGLTVKTVEVTDGTFVWTESDAGDYFPATYFVALADEGDLQPRVAVVTLRIFVVAIVVVGSDVFEYITGPPGIERVFLDDATTMECMTGDLNDVFAPGGVGGFATTTTGVIKVSGAPARLRGVTAIYTGFTRARLTGELFVTAFEEALGILDTDVQVICWPVIDGVPIPVFEITIDRQVLPFDIESVVSMDWYPPVLFQQNLETSFDVVWEGSPQFPVTLTFTNNTCFVNFTCTGGSIQHSEEANPLVQLFGCVSDSPTARSGFTRWTVQLEDANGLQTSPATFSARCGQEPV